MDRNKVKLSELVKKFESQINTSKEVCITPCESLSPLKRSPKHRTLTMSPNTSSVFIPGVSYVISHPAPPERTVHIENVKNKSAPSSTTPATTTTNTAATSGPLSATGQNHFDSHLKNIRMFHQDLQDRIKNRHPELGSGSDGRRNEYGVIENVSVFPDTSSISSVTTSFLVKNLRKNLQELDVVHQKLQQRLATSDIPTQKGSEFPEPRTMPSLIEKGLTRKSTDKEDLSSYSNSIPSDLNTNTNHHSGSMEDMRYHKDEPLREQYQDAKSHPEVGRISPGHMSDNWEDSVQFGDVDTKQRGHYRDIGHDDKDDDDDDDDGFFVIPKALNDVSSANFVNTLGINNEGVSRSAHTMDHSEHDHDIFVRLQGEPDGLQPRERMRDIERRDNYHADDDQASAGIGGVHNEKDADEHVNRFGTRGLDRTFSVSEGSTESLEAHGHTAQEQQHLPEVHDQNQVLDKGRSRILADATNHQHHGAEGREQDSLIHTLVTEDDPSRIYPASSDKHPEMMHAQRKTNLPSENLDPKENITSTRITCGISEGPSANNSNTFIPIHEPHTDNDSLPRQVHLGPPQGQTSSQSQPLDTEGSLQRQRSLSWSSDDSVVLTLDPQVAEKQQKYMEERGAAVPVESSTVPSSHDPVPNFFLPPQDLEASMRALHSAVTFLPRSQPREGAVKEEDSSERSYQKSQAAQELANRLGGAVSMTTHQHSGGIFTKKPKLKVPSAEEAKRIAKIFGSKYSMPF